MSKRKAIIISIIILILGLSLGIGFGMILFKGCSNPTFYKESSNVIIPDSIIKEEKNILDSLEKEIIIREEVISHLKDSIQIKEVIRTIEIDNIKELPLDSSVIFLKSKLREYEGKY